MADLPDDLAARIAGLRSDRESGASELLSEAVDILKEAVTRGTSVVPAAAALVRAQPSMAPLWNAAVEAVASRNVPRRFETFARRVERAPKTLVRHALDYFGVDPGERPLSVATISFSASVIAVVEALARTRYVHTACAEGRPALEGRRLASRLAESGVPVTLFSDAAIAHGLAAVDAVLVGADAVASEWFFNKSGTRMLAAAAHLQAIPVYVIATREKFVSPAVAAQLTPREGSESEIWQDPPRGVRVRNPYFERTPLELVTAVISDLGVLGAGMVPDVCEGMQDAGSMQALDQILVRT